MGVRYPGPVSRHNLVCPFVFMVPCPRLGPFICHDGGCFAFGRLGHPGLNPKRGVGRSGRESVMAVDRFCQNIIGPPEWECDAMGSVVWVKCATSAECINLSIAAPVDKAQLVSKSHHGSTFIN